MLEHREDGPEPTSMLAASGITGVGDLRRPDSLSWI